jgi:hypothetical protein
MNPTSAPRASNDADASAAASPATPADPSPAKAGGPRTADVTAVGQEAVALLRDIELAAKHLAQLGLAEAQLSYGALRTAFFAGIIRNVLAGAAVALVAVAGAIALAQSLDSWPYALLIIGAATAIGAFVAARIRHKAWARVGMPHTRELIHRWSRGKGEDEPHQ